MKTVLVEKNIILEWVLYIEILPEILNWMFLVKQLKILLNIILIDWLKIELNSDLL